ncbi:serine-type D-Ala-D-Ala carboxypeptidase [Legionella steigerwaltii]|uniref:Serine-type D-Ala-D-Ala carboxypeptidase n=1 Tax=Legionella steigerwaltii TaxID=460 RepID=A0A378L9S1_9GAMM|nr:D-alanyl-D-alanine carboxypeptidase [Legionella steigerwaltii]KTD77472.1 serine-type D-Ala-D-Ala carboxypeptidase [Legionella steigerwaltii]STY22672.1 serine-type D-Ala-D-Ala carboxypeptidase [Legionella steigerwaltii]
MVTITSHLPVFPVFFDALPILGVDGSLATVTEFQTNPSLLGATGKVHAKTGTFLQETKQDLVLKSQAFFGYIDATSGRRLVYQLVVNDVKISSITDVIQVFQNEGILSAVLWRDF